MRLQEHSARNQGTARQGKDLTDALPAQPSPNSFTAHDAEWLLEMKSRLAAVEAWRGFPTHHRRQPKTN